MSAPATAAITSVEPIISAQWFVKMEPLAREAMRVVKDGEVKFVPERFSKTYLNWMENVHDWCISRQLWWGHQIPAWYCADCGKMTCTREDPDACQHCGSKNITRDPDVLDTWFSSALWPFSTLGWPDKTEDLDYFYPTDVLVTGYDIIFFWVARMIFSGREQTKKPPVPHRAHPRPGPRRPGPQDVQVSLGNGIDPLEMIDQFGCRCPALQPHHRQLLPATICASTPSAARPCATSANKIWNASRFLLMNLTIDQCALPEQLELEDKWILSKLNDVIRDVTANMDSYELGCRRSEAL